MLAEIPTVLTVNLVLLDVEYHQSDLLFDTGLSANVVVNSPSTSNSHEYDT